MASTRLGHKQQDKPLHPLPAMHASFMLRLVKSMLKHELRKMPRYKARVLPQQVRFAKRAEFS